jgi:hypothetical protein
MVFALRAGVSYGFILGLAVVAAVLLIRIFTNVSCLAEVLQIWGNAARDSLTVKSAEAVGSHGRYFSCSL